MNKERIKKNSSKRQFTEKIKTDKHPLNIEWTWRKNKQMFPDFSGKYHGKLNDE